MKEGYSIDKPMLFTKTKFIYVFNYNELNNVAHLCFRRDFKERYSNKKECIGVWKIKKLI